jgi:hypothetical protein
MRKCILIGLVIILALSVEASLYTNNPRPNINVTFSETVTVLSAYFDHTAYNPLPTYPSTSFKFRPAANLADGLHEFKVTVADTIGNQNTYNKNFTIDRISPVIYNLTPSAGNILYESSRVFQYRVDEPVNAWYYELNGKSYYFQTLDNQSFSRTFSSLQDGTKFAYLFVADNAGNPASETYDFDVATQPPNIILVEPQFGFSKVQSFDIKIRTSMLSYCTYILNPDEAQKEFDHFDGQNHTLPITINSNITLYVSCSSYFGFPASKTFSIRFDNIPPQIELTANPQEITEKTSGITTEPVYSTTLKVKLVSTQTDPFICKYSKNLVSGTPVTIWEDMIPFDDYDAYDADAFKEETTQRLIGFENKKQYDVYVSCRDLAGNLGHSSVRVTVNEPEQPLVIIHHPQNNGYISATSVILNASTNMNANFCKYSTSSDMAGAIQFSNGGTFHTATLSLSDGTDYTYYVECSFTRPEGLKTAKASVSFSMDNSNPIMTKSQIKEDQSGKIYRTDRLQGEWQGEDNESGIERYEVKVYKDKFSSNDELIKTITTTSTSKTITVNLENSQTYFLKVRAKNGAGMWSTVKESNKVIVDTSITPSIPDICTNNIWDPANESDMDCGKDCPDCTAGKKCVDSDDCSGTLFCNDLNKCAEPSCTDKVKNGDETDVDCGGSCSKKCAKGKDCLVGSDCDTNTCENGICKETDLCDNNVLNAGETDVDCGGICLQRVPPKSCDIGQFCETDDDCDQGAKCLNLICTSCGTNDLDCDGIPNSQDDDIDGDGKKNWEDPDDDNDGLCDTKNSPLNDDSCEGNDDDDDNDGVKDSEQTDAQDTWCYVAAEGKAYKGSCAENGVTGQDVIDGDLDNDGIPNFLDDDIDGDGLKNWEDPDDDNDGLCDDPESPLNDESCSGGDSDDDNDGILDANEIDWDNDLDNDGIQNEQDDDMDGDGVANSLDTDNDNDGQPDSLDPDDDNDGVQDIYEDNDGDGMADSWEREHGLDPNDPTDADKDKDGDGLTNLEEYRKGTDPGKKDTDGDGYSDKEEIDKGTDPLNAEDYPKSPWLWILFLILFVLLLLGIGYYLFREYSEYGSFDHLKHQLRDTFKRWKRQFLLFLQKAGILDLLEKMGVKITIPPEETKSAQPMQRQMQRPIQPMRRPIRRPRPVRRPMPAPVVKAPEPRPGMKKQKTLSDYVDLEKFSDDEVSALKTIPDDQLEDTLGNKEDKEIKEILKKILDKLDSEGKKPEDAKWYTIPEFKNEVEKPIKKKRIKKQLVKEAKKQRIHEVFSKLSKIKTVDSEHAKEHLDALSDMTGKKITPKLKDHIEHVITSKKVDKEKVLGLMHHLSKGTKMTADDHANMLGHLVKTRKMGKKDAYLVLNQLKDKKAVSSSDHKNIFDQLKAIGNAKK